jgi:hypothetical protein
VVGPHTFALIRLPRWSMLMRHSASTAERGVKDTPTRGGGVVKPNLPGITLERWAFFMPQESQVVIVAGPVLLNIPLEEPVLSAFLACPPTVCVLAPAAPDAPRYTLISNFGHWAPGQAVRITFGDHTRVETVIETAPQLTEGYSHYTLIPCAPGSSVVHDEEW